MNKYIYIVLNYVLLKDNNKAHAISVRFNRCNNLKPFLIDNYYIKTSNYERAALNIIHIADNKKQAESIVAAWNDTYIKEGRFFEL